MHKDIPPEMARPHIGLDSKETQTHLGIYGRMRKVDSWLKMSKEERFSLSAVESVLKSRFDQLTNIEGDLVELENDPEKAKAHISHVNLCSFALKDIAENGNDGAFGKLLENLKKPALIEVLTDTESVREIWREKFNPEVIAVFVTKRILSAFFETYGAQSLESEVQVESSYFSKN